MRCHKLVIVTTVLLTSLLLIKGNEKTHKNGFKKPDTKQLIMVGVEFGIPFDIANTLTNPLGRTLTSLSLVGISVFLALGIVMVPYDIVADVLDPDGLFSAASLVSGRKKRSLLERRTPPSLSSITSLLDIEDGFSLLGETDPACRC